MNISARKEGLREVRLYGHLRKKFGKSFWYAVNTPAQAVQALRATLPGFTEHVLQHNKPGYHVFMGNDSITKLEDLALHTKKVIKIIPVVVGAGGNKLMGLVYIVVGALLIYFSAGTATPWVSAAASAVGMALVSLGITSLLAASPKKPGDQREREPNQPSYIFNGAVNTTAQGNPVPLCYGTMIVGSQVISAGFNAEALPIDGVAGAGQGEGGGQSGGEQETFVNSTIPAEPAYRINLNIESGWVSPSRVTAADGISFIQKPFDTEYSLQSNEYFVQVIFDDGVWRYTFSAANAGQSVVIYYNHRVLG